MHSIRNVRCVTLMSLMTALPVGCGSPDDLDEALEDDFRASSSKQTQKAFEDQEWDDLLRMVHVYKDTDFRGESKIYKEDVRDLPLPFTLRYTLGDDYKDAVKSINLKQRCMMTLFAGDDFKAVVRTYGGSNSAGGVLRNFPPKFHAFEITCWDKTRAYGTVHTRLDGEGDYYYLFSTYSQVPLNFGDINSIRVNQTTYGSSASAKLLTYDPPEAPPRPVPVLTTVTRNQNVAFLDETLGAEITAVRIYSDYFKSSCSPKPSCYINPGCTGEKLTNVDTGGPPSYASICWRWASDYGRQNPSYCTRDGLCISPATGDSSWPSGDSDL
ncbi:MAG: hypothetical protein AAFU77_14120 [Myxococcota bacterium]